jgi:integrase
VKLTKTSLRLCVLKPGETDRIFPDDELPGFGLRVRKGGSRKWVLHYRHAGTQRRHTIGPAHVFTLEEARRKARKVIFDLDEGRDPAALKEEKRTAAAMTFGSIVEDYLAARQAFLKPRSFAESTRHLRQNWEPLHRLPIAGVTRLTVATQLREVTKTGAINANRARTVLSAFFVWAIGEGLCEANPVIGTNANPESARDRVLSTAELVSIWNAVPESDYGRIIRLLMLTGQRREEIGGLQWSELKGEGETALIALPAHRTKNGLAHDVPLSPAARFEIPGRAKMNGDKVFARCHWSRCKDALDKVLELEPWVLHDLRRSAATGMADVGVQPHVIEAVLNHVSGHKAGVAGIYNRSTYAPEKRAALELWASHLIAAIEASQ